MTQVKPHTFLEKCIKDEKGNLTIFQKPNLPIIFWFVSMICTKLVPTGNLQELLSLVSFGSLFTWAWLEIFSGTNYLRRLLGVVVIVVALWSRL